MSAVDSVSLMNSRPQYGIVHPEGPVFSADGAALDGPDLSKIQQYNFRNPGFISQADLRHIGLLYDRFAQHLSARLSTFLRMECVLKITTFSSNTFAKFVESISTQTHISLFQAEPLRGIGLLDMDLALSLAMADRLLGGKGRVPEAARPLTEIEAALLEDAVLIILTEWTRLWEDENWVFEPRCIGTETSGRFLQTSPPDAIQVACTMELALGESVGNMQLGIPFTMVEPLVKKLHKRRHRGEDGEKQIQWRAPFEGIVVPVTAEWEIREYAVRELISLKPGDVIPLSRDLIKKTRVRLAGNAEFTGHVGVQNGHVAVQLTERITGD